MLSNFMVSDSRRLVSKVEVRRGYPRTPRRGRLANGAQVVPRFVGRPFSSRSDGHLLAALRRADPRRFRRLVIMHVTQKSDTPQLNARGAVPSWVYPRCVQTPEDRYVGPMSPEHPSTRTAQLAAAILALALTMRLEQNLFSLHRLCAGRLNSGAG